MEARRVVGSGDAERKADGNDDQAFAQNMVSKKRWLAPLPYANADGLRPGIF